MLGPGTWDGPSCVGEGHTRSLVGLSGGAAPGGLPGESCGACSLWRLDFLGQTGSPPGPGLTGEGRLRLQEALSAGGGVLLLLVSSLISDPSLWRALCFTTGTVTLRGALASDVMVVADLGPLVCACHAERPLTQSPGRHFWPGVSCRPLELPPRLMSSLRPPGGGDPRVTVLRVSGGGA